jgi:hypothetical protein
MYTLNVTVTSHRCIAVKHNILPHATLQVCECVNTVDYLYGAIQQSMGIQTILYKAGSIKPQYAKQSCECLKSID